MEHFGYLPWTVSCDGHVTRLLHCRDETERAVYHYKLWEWLAGRGREG